MNTPQNQKRLEDLEEKLESSIAQMQGIIDEIKTLSSGQKESDLGYASKVLETLGKRRARRKKGHSGTKGVNKFISSSGKVSWHTSIGFGGELHFLGYFDTYEEARAVRLEAEKRLGVKRN